MKRTIEEIMDDFVDFAANLSPENLYRDGLATPEEVTISLESIEQGWNTLEKEIGYKVSVEDAWEWFRMQKEALNPKEDISPVQEVKKKPAFGLKRK